MGDDTILVTKVIAIIMILYNFVFSIPDRLRHYCTRFKANGSEHKRKSLQVKHLYYYNEYIFSSIYIFYNRGRSGVFTRNHETVAIMFILYRRWCWSSSFYDRMFTIVVTTIVDNVFVFPYIYIYIDCMTVWSEEGHLYYKSTTSDPSVCGIYIVAKPEQTVHVYFDYVDVPCNTGGLIAVSVCA